MKAYTELTDRHRAFIETQQMFFVATAPLAEEGHVNLSPKGLDSFAVLGPDRVAYIDLGGSGIETHAHLRENGRICLMFCAFAGKPLILRLYGRGRAHLYGEPGFDALRDRFAHIDVPVRGVIEVELDRVQDSCGWGVPLYDYVGQRERLVDAVSQASQADHIARVYEKNARSIDGLPGAVKAD
jgi:hypothetical protein